MAELPADLTGRKVLPDFSVIRSHLQAQWGLAQGNRDADRIVDLTMKCGFYVVFDMRLETPSIPSLICESPQPDGNVVSVDFPITHIRCALRGKRPVVT